MDTSKKTFLFNADWYEVLVDYPSEIRLEVYEAVIRYAVSGTLSELRPQAKMAFSFIKREIDFNQKNMMREYPTIGNPVKKEVIQISRKASQTLITQRVKKITQHYRR